MTTAQTGDRVSFHYTGTLEDGSIFDSSEGRAPLECTLGSGEIIEGLEAALIGMGEGEEKTTTIPAELAYGAHDPLQIQTVARDTLPDDVPVTVGTRLQARTPEGQVIPLVITSFTEADVVLDANHPLAGKDLTFAVRLEHIVPA
jgi:peptidylprolyl isomerase